jgi:hypothetical protein
MKSMKDMKFKKNKNSLFSYLHALHLSRAIFTP